MRPWCPVTGACRTHHQRVTVAAIFPRLYRGESLSARVARQEGGLGDLLGGAGRIAGLAADLPLRQPGCAAAAPPQMIATARALQQHQGASPRRPGRCRGHGGRGRPTPAERPSAAGIGRACMTRSITARNIAWPATNGDAAIADIRQRGQRRDAEQNGKKIAPACQAADPAVAHDARASRRRAAAGESVGRVGEAVFMQPPVSRSWTDRKSGRAMAAKPSSTAMAYTSTAGESDEQADTADMRFSSAPAHAGQFSRIGSRRRVRNIAASARSITGHQTPINVVEVGLDRSSLSLQGRRAYGVFGGDAKRHRRGHCHCCLPASRLHIAQSVDQRR